MAYLYRMYLSFFFQGLTVRNKELFFESKERKKKEREDERKGGKVGINSLSKY